MKKIVFIITFFMCLVNTAYPQENIYYHKVHFELLGNNAFYSFNYEYSINESINIRYGQTFIPSFQGEYDHGDDSGTWLLLGVNYLSHLSDNSFLEYGLNISRQVKGGNPFISGTIGYRYEPKGKGTIYRITFVPVLSEKSEFIPWLGLSIGYKFSISAL